MFKRRVALMLALLGISVAQTAQAFIDPPYITPTAPVAGETVSVDIGYGVCDLIGTVQSITQDGHAIRVLLSAVRYTDPFMCNFPPDDLGVYPVGAYPPGSYTLQVDIIYVGSTGQYVTETLAILPFTVAAAPASTVSAPINDHGALALLMLALLGLAGRQLRIRESAWLLIAVLSTSLDLRAQDAPNPPVIELLLTTAPGAPTPEQLVSYFDRLPRGGPLPLQALSVGNPSDVQYLMPVRAEGDFLAWLQANPTSPRAQLENYVVVLYPPGTNITLPLAALRSDPYVAGAHVPSPSWLSSVSLLEFEVDGPAQPQGGGQYGRTDLNIDAAWQIAGGWALVAEIDMGLYQLHPALRQFADNGNYLSGNFIPIASLDIGRSGGVLPPNNGPDYSSVDEARPLDYTDTGCTNPVPVALGHGTHTAGLLAANGGSGQGVQGTCKHCGLAEWKISYTTCDRSSHQVLLVFNSLAEPRAITSAVDSGAQVLSMSFGVGDPVCANTPTPPLCLAIQYASDHDTAMVAASGNNRADLQYPTIDSAHVISAGGFDDSISLWDESPGSTTNCPVVTGHPPGTECGSNYTQINAVVSYDHQELMASCKHVLSTTYPNFDYVAYAECGDSYGTPMGDGIGWCTGTSMSTPQIAGVVGILRSINPLTPVGTPYGAAGTVRKVLASTTYEAQAGHAWERHFGYGRPDAAAAARTTLGGPAGTRNRVTPLFRLLQCRNARLCGRDIPAVRAGLDDQSEKGMVACLHVADGSGLSEFSARRERPATAHAEGVGLRDDDRSGPAQR